MSSGVDQFAHMIKQAASQQNDQPRPFAFGHIASYDPKTGRVRVIIPTLRGDDGTPVLTPWMKLGTAFAGNGFGLQVAPEGGASFDNPTAGEQVLVSIIDADSGTSLAASMLFSDAQLPPFPDMVGGEFGLQAKGGSFVRLKADKSLVLDTSAGGGNVVVNAGTGKVQVTGAEIDLTGLVKITGDLWLSGTIKGVLGAIYAGAIATAGELFAKFGTGGQVSLSGHTHTQAIDSHGDSESPTAAPTGGT